MRFKTSKDISPVRFTVKKTCISVQFDAWVLMSHLLCFESAKGEFEAGLKMILWTWTENTLISVYILLSDFVTIMILSILSAKCTFTIILSQITVRTILSYSHPYFTDEEKLRLLDVK